MRVNIVFLAAGKGTRFNFPVPKPLGPFAGTTMLGAILKEVNSIDSFEKDFIFVLGHEKEKIQSYLNQNFENLSKQYVVQEPQMGTGHALRCFFEQCPNSISNKLTYVLCADTPLLKKEVLQDLQQNFSKNGSHALAASFVTKSPTGYGRIVSGKSGITIVEEKAT